MELQYFGGNCLRITSKKAQIVVDDNLEQLGLKPVTKPTDIALHTFRGMPKYESKFIADIPGEYETSGVTIRGIAARAHMDDDNKHSAVIYTISDGDIK